MRIFFLLATLLVMNAGFSQTLFTYGENAVSKDEFLRAYNKNKTTVADKAAALKDYLDLYSRFKLKVQAAKELRLDTLQQLKYDVQNFRSQVEEGYLNDDKAVETLLDEAIQRSQQDIHLLHFYVAISNKMDAADTIKANKAIKEAYEELKEGKTDYNELVDEITEKVGPIKGKDLGYITAFSLPYEIENLVYNLKPGEISRIYRTKSALHVFKNAEVRKSAGKWKVAQILLAIPPDANGDNIKKMQSLADSLYKVIKEGANFADLAKRYSDDKLTYMNGGEMSEFGTGKFDLPFELKVFALKNDGDITEPILSEYGFHIVKRLQQVPTPTDKNDGAFAASIKQQVLQDTRINIAKVKFAKEVMLKTGFKRNTAVKDEVLYRYADSITNTKEVGKYPINNLTIFSFAKSSVKGSDWLNFVKDYKLNADVYKGENNKDLLDKYITTTSLEYYRNHLEEFNADFKYQIQEFTEGNMLFEIMEKNVWSKASNDTAGLKNYYDMHKAKYTWAESADVHLFNCNSMATAQEAMLALQKGKNWKAIADESDGRIQSDSGRYEIAQIQVQPGVKLTEGLITNPLLNSGDNTANFVQVLKLFPANQQRSFEEARGLVINDFQGQLEEQWIGVLKKKSPVKVNEAVFQSMLK